jgi:hypothetical protein
LVVNFRAYAELASCLESLRRFVADDTEVIVVDHLSEPLAAAVVERTFPWIQFIARTSNPGFAAGVNRAAQAASGRYLLLLNPDSIVDGDVNHVLAAWLDDHPDVGACGALVRQDDGSVQPSARRFPDVTTAFAGRTTWLTRAWPGNPWTRRNLVVQRVLEDAVEVDWVTGACMMLRREAFDAVGGMDDGFFMYWEDADLCFRLKRAGWSTAYNPAVGITHLTGRSSATARRQSLIAFHRGAYRYFAKHAGGLSRAATPAVFLALEVRLWLKLYWPSTKLHFTRRRS